MSYPLTQLGSSAFNHQSSASAEQEYDRLRGLARQEASKRSSCLDRSHEAYTHGDGATAKHLSDEAHRHAALMAQYNEQASNYIFRANNAPDRGIAADTIDLHGQYVEEAERILETRLRAARAEGQTHLHVIVGRGEHSPGHVQKLKPKVEQLCEQLGLRYETEPNAGRIYVDLRSGAAGGGGGGGGGQMMMPGGVAEGGGYGGGYGGGGGGAGGGGGGHHHQQQQQQHQHQQHHQQHHHQQQEEDPNAKLEAEVKKALPKILRQIKRSCCVVM